MVSLVVLQIIVGYNGNCGALFSRTGSQMAERLGSARSHSSHCHFLRWHSQTHRLHTKIFEVERHRLQAHARTLRMCFFPTEVNLIEFSEPGVFNYSTLLMSEEKEVLYVGAREAIFELNIRNVSIRNNKVLYSHPVQC